MLVSDEPLHVLICEDEYLLASNLAVELKDRGVSVAGIVARVSDALAALEDDNIHANAVILDAQLLDGPSFSLVAPMSAKGLAIVICSGYGPHDIPAEFADVPTVGKPTDTDQLLAALIRARTGIVESSKAASR